MNLEDLTVYVIANELSEDIYSQVIQWDWFNKKTTGVQLLESSDSIGANIAEGYGRYHKKDKIKFYYNARGSVLETKYWLNKSKERKLISSTNCL